MFLKFLTGRENKNKNFPDIEPQEVFLDRLAKKREQELGVSEQKLETLVLNKILLAFFSGILVIFLILLAKSFQLQIFQKEKFLSLAQDNWQRHYLIQPQRGVIYDSTGKQLVFNKASFDLIFDKRDFSFAKDQGLEIIKKVAEILEIEPEELKNKIIHNESNQVLISENISHQTLILLETLFSQKETENLGFKIEETTTRQYPKGEILAHWLGYTGKISKEELFQLENYSIFDYIGREGIEKSYEQILRGKPGILQIEKDAFGNLKSEETISLPEPGKSLTLWLDLELQEKIFHGLQSQLKNIGSTKAAAVALNPKTGGVMALVSIPSFDNNLFSQGISPDKLEEISNNPLKPLFNRAISGQYATGSTIKPLIATAALEEKIISPQKNILCQGQIEIPHQYNPEITYYFRDWKSHGITDLRKAIAESCNVYFYTIGGGFGDQEGLGPSRIKKYLQNFGWGGLTQINIPGEAKGLIPSPEWKKENKKEPWWDGDTYHLSIGQGDILATPLQVVSSFLAIANGGKLLQPQIVKEIQDQGKIEPQILKENFVDPENLKIVRQGMREAVTYGSSVLLNSLPVKSAAKTGTAQTPRPGYYHNWITVFAPYEDPEIVLTLLIEDVKDMQAVVLPVAKEILAWYFSR